MDFADRISELCNQIPKRAPHIQTEEATKNAFILPFISALGYDIFNPVEVNPELTADVGIKKGEKVDYAIMKEGKPIFLIECKTTGTNLALAHSSQLYRYFSVTDARFGVLTNGIEYRFFSDLDKPNKMDDKPFLVVDLLDLKPGQIDELKKFTKDQFNVDEIVSVAGELKYSREIMRILNQQLVEPDEDFIRYFVNIVYSGRMTQNVREQFATIIKSTLGDFIEERVNRRLQKALDTTETGESAIIFEDDLEEEEEIPPEEQSTSRRITTTEDEIEGYHIVKSILREVVDAKRIFMRDTQSYCGVLLDDNNRKPLTRLHFNRNQYYIGIFDTDKNEDRISINNLDDIYNYVDRLQATVGYYDNGD